MEKEGRVSGKRERDEEKERESRIGRRNEWEREDKFKIKVFHYKTLQNSIELYTIFAIILPLCFSFLVKQ